MAHQAVLVGGNIEKRFPILNFEKFPLGHCYSLHLRANDLALYGKVRFRTGAKQPVHKLD